MDTGSHPWSDSVFQSLQFAWGSGIVSVYRVVMDWALAGVRLWYGSGVDTFQSPYDDLHPAKSFGVWEVFWVVIVGSNQGRRTNTTLALMRPDKLKGNTHELKYKR